MSDEIDDLSFPNAVLTRLMNEALGESTTISKEARAAMSRAALTFILYISTTANQYASNAKRKTVTVQDIFKALQSNQFDMLVEPLQEALKDYQEQIRKKKEETLKKQQTQSEATIENNDNDEEEEEINEPTIE
jgi:DNA polymerase epsilon subunit 3